MLNLSPRVLDFNGAFRKKRIEPVWEHGCGSQTFYLHEDGHIECARCHDFLSKTWSEAASASARETESHG